MTTHKKRKQLTFNSIYSKEISKSFADENDIRIAEKRLLKAEKEGTYTHEEMMKILGLDR